MAKADFPLSMDRRRLLFSAAALPAASIVPGIQGGEPANLAGRPNHCHRHPLFRH